MSNKLKALKFGFISIAILTMVGCSSKTSVDPLEPINRTVYGFNKITDRVLIRPVARVYKAVVPKPIRTLGTNFLNNIGEVPTFANDILQFKFDRAAKTTARFALNTTLGVFGLFDVAGYSGLPIHHEDFGQTLARWGYKSSSYLILPILGPSTIRDGIGIFADYYMSPQTYQRAKTRNAINISRGLDDRTRLLETEKVIDAAGVDEYALVRDAYLQHREYLIKDKAGESKVSNDNEELLGEPPL